MKTYYMPVKIFQGDIKDFGDEFIGYGDKALIVTGKSSAKNGSLDDVLYVLAQKKIAYVIFDEIKENPTVESIEEGRDFGKKEKIDFIIAIGGGSPLDAGKAIGILIANPQKTGDDLFLPEPLKSLPILAIPTTAGTGSETTPYSILTYHKVNTKVSISQFIFPEKAFLNGRYMDNLPEKYTLSTALDAFSHLCEGYTSALSTYLSDSVAMGGLINFSRCMENLEKRNFTNRFRDDILNVSSLAGMVISQSKTTLPHQLGYALTYFKDVPHGYACCIFMYEYLKNCEKCEDTSKKVKDILRFLGMDSLDELKVFLDKVTDVKIKVSLQEIEEYADALLETPAKLKTTPFEVDKEILVGIYRRSLGI